MNTEIIIKDRNIYKLLVYIWKPSLIHTTVAIVSNGANRLYIKYDLFSAKGEYMP